jgi:hypothetical protein
VGESLNEEACTMEHSGKTSAGDPNAHKYQPNAIPIELQTEFVRFHDNTCLTCLEGSRGFNLIGVD